MHTMKEWVLPFIKKLLRLIVTSVECQAKRGGGEQEPATWLSGCYDWPLDKKWCIWIQGTALSLTSDVWGMALLETFRTGFIFAWVIMWEDFVANISCINYLTSTFFKLQYILQANMKSVYQAVLLSQFCSTSSLSYILWTVSKIQMLGSALVWRKNELETNILRVGPGQFKQCCGP
jgi:hypothetical protein